MNMISNDRRIEILPRSALKPDSKNPRRHSDKQIEQIISSLRRFGFRGALIVDDQNRLVVGNAVLEAMRRLEMDEVPVIRETFLSDAERRAFALAHNRLAELGEWDPEALDDELRFLFDSDVSFDGTGFELKDLDLSLGDPPQDELMELPSTGPAVSRPGDLWHIGEQRLLCGDARHFETFETLLGGDRARIVFGDLPYNVPIDGHVGGNGRNVPREFAMASGEMNPAEFTGFLRSIFRNCVFFSVAGSIHYQCMDWRHSREILDAADGIYTEFKQLVVWAKPSGGQGAFYRSRHELVFVFKSGRARHINNFGLGSGGRYRTNVVEYPGAAGFRRGRKRDLADHCTVKPTAMVADFLIDCSNPGDLVLDPCAGSGTTLLAAHHTRRRGAAIEIDPLYVDTAIRRLMEASGQTAMLTDGRTFEEVSSDREVCAHD